MIHQLAQLAARFLKKETEMAIGLIILGLVIAAGSFIFAAVNMGKQVRDVFAGDSDPFSGFAGMFTRHIGAMIGMVVGGLIAAIGVVLGIVQLVQMFTK